MKRLGSQFVFGAIIAVVLLNTFLAFQAVLVLVENERWHSHTLEVISQTQALFAQVRTAESAARAYVLTGEPVFEERYRTAERDVEQRVDAVTALTSDNKSQQLRLPVVRQRIAVKFAGLDVGIAARHAHPDGPPSVGELTPMLLEMPDGGITVAYAIQQLENEERRLLVDRDRESRNSKLLVWIALSVAAIIDLAFILIAMRLTLVSQRSRDEVTRKADQIATLNRELGTINADLESRVQQRTHELELSNKELEAFSYSVSHDLRAPLRTIDGFSLALYEDYAERLDETGLDYIQRVRNGVQRMGGLIDALLQLSRVSRTEVQRETVDLSTLTTLVFNELTMSVNAEQKARFTAQPGITANADAKLLRVAFENLIGNALKFTSKTAEPRIEFGSGIKDGRTVYFIRDNGAGFDMKYVDRLFTAFQRLHGDRDFKGSGIGLATVSRIIRRHHGAIWAEGQIDQGATFHFTLDV